MNINSFFSGVRHTNVRANQGNPDSNRIVRTPDQRNLFNNDRSLDDLVSLHRYERLDNNGAGDVNNNEAILEQKKSDLAVKEQELKDVNKQISELYEKQQKYNEELKALKAQDGFNLTAIASLKNQIKEIGTQISGLVDRSMSLNSAISALKSEIEELEASAANESSDESSEVDVDAEPEVADESDVHTFVPIDKKIDLQTDLPDYDAQVDVDIEDPNEPISTKPGETPSPIDTIEDTDAVVVPETTNVEETPSSTETTTVVEGTYINNSGLVCKKEVETTMDASGNLVNRKTNYYDENNKLSSQTVSTYENGKEKTQRKEFYNPDGKVVSTMEYEFDSNENVRTFREVTYNEKGQSRQVQQDFTDNGMYENISVYGEDGKFVSQVSKHFDNSGNLEGIFLDTVINGEHYTNYIEGSEMWSFLNTDSYDKYIKTEWFNGQRV